MSKCWVSAIIFNFVWVLFAYLLGAIHDFFDNLAVVVFLSSQHSVFSGMGMVSSRSHCVSKNTKG